MQKTETTKISFFLSFIEGWERFSYYGMRALLVLYLVSVLGFADQNAYAIYVIFAAVGYAIPVIGGIIADKFLGFQKTLIIGAFGMCIGYFILSISQDILHFYCGLSLIAIGIGFFKGNVTNLLGSIYPTHSKERDKGFSYY